jgi:Ser-tRNA(Ala) deacylase AlaX
VDGRILHFVDGEVPEGPVRAELDMHRRLDHMQQHTAQHLLTAHMLRHHSMPTTAFHLGDAYSAIEVDGPVPGQDDLEHIEDEVNEQVRRGLAVTTRWVEREDMERLGVRSRLLPEGHEGRIRVIEIQGLDLNTCGGTHVRNLCELQAVHLTHAEPARGGARIHFLAGGRVLSHLRHRGRIEAALKERLATTPDDFAKVIDGWLADRRRQRRQIQTLEKQNASYLAAEIAAEEGPHVERTIEHGGPELLRFVAGAVVKLRPEMVISLVTGGDPVFFLVQAGPRGPEDVGEIGRALAERLGARGGGKGRSFQGRT